jgi:hypothetical protein
MRFVYGNIKVEAGKLRLLEDFAVAQSGKALSAEQAKLLVHLGLKLVKFQASVLAKWCKGSFEALGSMGN